MSIQIYNEQSGLTRIDKRQHKLFLAFVQPLSLVKEGCVLVVIGQVVTVTAPRLLWEPVLACHMGAAYSKCWPYVCSVELYQIL